MAEPKVELAFTIEELHILWAALTHKERCHREWAEKLETTNIELRQSVVDLNTHALGKVKALCDFLEEAMQHLEPQFPADGHQQNQ